MQTRHFFLLAFIALAPAFATAQTTVVFRQGFAEPITSLTYSGVQDTMVLTNASGSEERDFGARDGVEVGAFGAASNGLRHGLMRFDVTALAGQYTAINSVTLRLYAFAGASVSTANTLEAHLVAAANSGWVPGTGVGNTTATGGASTWLYLNQSSFGNGTAWAGSAGASTAGTDYLSGTVGTVAWSGSPSNGTAFDLVFTDLSYFDLWVSGTNSGIFLRNATEPTTGGDNRFFFYSSNFATTTLRPELIVNYTAVPEPSSYAILAGILALAVAQIRRRRGIVCSSPNLLP